MEHPSAAAAVVLRFALGPAVPGATVRLGRNIDRPLDLRGKPCKVALPSGNPDTPSLQANRTSGSLHASLVPFPAELLAAWRSAICKTLLLQNTDSAYESPPHRDEGVPKGSAGLQLEAK